jgi:multiple sugar transport system substrate-binding protein
MKKSLRWLAALAVTLMLAVAAGCGGGGDDDEGGAAPDAEKAGQAKASGNVTWCIGKDTSGAFGTVVDNFNKANPDANVKLLELPEDAGEQRRLQIQRLQAESAECDVLGMDVIWTAEYAAQGWLLDVSDFINENGDKFIESTVATTEYEGKNWAVPFNSNAGFIYFRTDQAQEAPQDWETLYEEAQKGNGVVYQGFRYEGLTVNFLELVYSAGGSVLSEDGKEATADSPEVKEVLEFMAKGIEDGAAPKAVTTYKEEESRRAFESGNATFMRNWPYAFALGNEAAKVKGKFAVEPYPEWEGGGKASVLGGHNMVISVHSDNPGATLKFIDYATSTERITKNAVKYSKTPTIGASFDDPEVKEAMPFADALRAGVENARARPVSPVYPQISEAIFKNVNAALSGSMSPEEALERADADINEALQTF